MNCYVIMVGKDNNHLSFRQKQKPHLSGQESGCPASTTNANTVSINVANVRVL